ncbi:hypothetical protein V1478_018368 [Vespula squamosa]|uniref:Uncharacterized protein n=1 Tax=Vespula squamosa TaxID=30214 RepID=A0ABD1ZUV8_VESSQ
MGEADSRGGREGGDVERGGGGWREGWRKRMGGVEGHERRREKRESASERESRNNKAKHQGRQALLQRLGPIQREEALIERLLNPLSRVGWLSKFESRGMPPPAWLRPANRRPVPACHLAGYPGTSMLSHADTST